MTITFPRDWKRRIPRSKRTLRTPRRDRTNCTIRTDPRSDAAVLTASDGSTKYLRHAVETSIADMRDGAVLEVPCDEPSKAELADWCLNAGHRIANPFDHWHIDHLLIQKWSTPL